MEIGQCIKCGNDVIVDKILGMHGKITKVYNIEGKQSEKEFTLCRDCLFEVFYFVDPDYLKH